MMNPLSDHARNSLLDSLTKGLTPAACSPWVHIGRNREFVPIRDDLIRLAAGGSCFRLLVGPSGSGKTHLLDISEQAALAQGLAVARVEIQPRHRFHGGHGASRALVSDIITGLRVKGADPGAGLSHVLDGLKERIGQGSRGAKNQLAAQVQAQFPELQSMRLGDAFTEVLAAYLNANGRGQVEAKVMRWLRAEYETVQGAKKELGVSAIIGDSDLLDYLHLLGRFCLGAGYRGLLLLIDEMSVLTQNLHGSVRQANFDVLLNALNRSGQGMSPGLGIMLAGTADFLEQAHRGLLSQESLRSRLAPSTVETRNSEMTGGPILRLTPLQAGQLLLLLRKARDLVFPSESGQRCPDAALEALLQSRLGRLGASEHLGPREVLKDFAALALALDRNPEWPWQEIMAGPASPAADPLAVHKSSPEPGSNSLSDLRL